MKHVVKLILAIFIFYSSGSWALSPFKIKKIELRGLQGIAASTVFNYLPVKDGDLLDDKTSSTIIRALFKTGFFNDISLARENDTLIVQLVERPAISNIKITGNDEISEEDLTEALKGIGLSKGKIFNRSLLEKVEQELQRQYFSLGKYGVKISSTLHEQERNRIAIDIEIDEGAVTRIRQINIIGNHAFSDKELLGVFNSGTDADYSLFGNDSQYSKQKLFGDVELLRSYYMDRGYVNFNIESTQVSITPDKSDVFVTININEGGKFTVDKVTLSGEFVVPEEELKKFISVTENSTFSRKLVSTSSSNITERLGVDGYAFANVNAHPEINNEKNTVSLTFFIDPGKRVYIRRVTFGGNVKTHDEVLRREMRQLEGGWYSTTKLERSKTRLFRTGFFEDINVETPLVPGRTDMVDVVINVTERPSGSVQASVGYGQGSGIILSGSINQNNFMGTGKSVGAEISNNQVNTIYSVNMTDPYYTIDGISRSFRGYFRKTDASAASSIAGYNSNVYGGSVSFGFPLSEYRRARLGLGFDNTEFSLPAITQVSTTVNEVDANGDSLLDGDGNQITTTTTTDIDNSPPTYRNFEKNYGNSFDTFTITGSWIFDTRDRIVFANDGFHTVLTTDVTVPGGDLQFYKVSLRQQFFWSFAKNWTIHFDATGAFSRGYGKTDAVPFYEHYFAGGAQSVRGFRANSLGPIEGTFGNNIGGTKKLVGVAEILAPNPFDLESKSVRLSFFVDAGGIYGNNGQRVGDVGAAYTPKAYLREVSAAYGFGFTWIAPIGALKFSWAWPLRKLETDQPETFQFSIGAPF